MIIDKVISQTAYDAIHTDYKGTWEAERDDWKDWSTVRDKFMGKRSMLALVNGKTCMLIEGQSLLIVPDELLPGYEWMKDKELQQDVIDALGGRSLLPFNETVKNVLRKCKESAKSNDVLSAYKAYCVHAKLVGTEIRGMNLDVFALGMNTATVDIGSASTSLSMSDT